MSADAAAPTIIRRIHYRMHDRSLCKLRADELGPALGERNCFVWIDIHAPTVDPLNTILHQLGAEISVGRHFDYPAVLPRVFEHPNCLVCYVYDVSDPDRHLHISNGLGLMEPSRLILVVSAGWVITFHSERIAALEYVESRSAAVFGTEGAGPAFIAYLLFQRCMYEYAHLNLANDNYLDRLQSGLQPDDFEEFADIIDLAHANILTLKKMISSLQIVLGRLTTMQTSFIDDDFRARILQLHKNAFPVRWALDSSRQFIDGIVAGMQTATSNRMSEIATVLTIVSTIVLPLTLITGIYGMNFDDIPEIHFRGGYYICLGIMLLVVLGQTWVFHRLGWLRSVTRALTQLFQAPKRKATQNLSQVENDADYTVARHSLPPREGLPMS